MPNHETTQHYIPQDEAGHFRNELSCLPDEALVGLIRYYNKQWFNQISAESPNPIRVHDSYNAAENALVTRASKLANRSRGIQTQSST
ncbi:MAG TPA: hypothetical protein VNE40_01570 [Candidatus Dormibacteraeota bacterium]|nr:hypothetical protein [Candidatus Dormibacteraeota bacterium]